MVETCVEFLSVFCPFKVAASTRRIATSQIPNYPSLPSQLLCQVQNVTLHVSSVFSLDLPLFIVAFLLNHSFQLQIIITPLNCLF